MYNFHSDGDVCRQVVEVSLILVLKLTVLKART